MAEVVTPDHSNALMGPAHGGPRIAMVRNPEFSFPARLQRTSAARTNQDGSDRRPASMHMNLPPSQPSQASHRRAVSTLPSFSFNASNTSGLTETPPDTPVESEESVPVTPSRRRHRRGGSEFVGGDSRLGVNSALSSSPTKSNAFPIPVPSAGPPPGARRGHAHRRSQAMSSHDVSNIMQPNEPRLSHSLPTTPLDHPALAPPLDRSTSAPDVKKEVSEIFGPPLDDVPARPPSRPRVGFDDNVTIIPRPLSTISSETESSMSTVLGHSYNNSISSVISMGTPSPPSARMPRMSMNASIDETSKARAKSSLEISKRVEKEGEWLKSRSSGNLKRPHSEMMMPTRTTFAEPDASSRPQPQQTKRSSIGHALGFDRRRSEPTISGLLTDPARLSVVSLQESKTLPEPFDNRESRDCEHMSSARKIKLWAASKINRRSKSPSKALTASSSGSSLRPVSAGSVFVPGKVTRTETPVAETDLDAVFNSEATAMEVPRPDTASQARAELSTPTPSQHSSFYSQDADDTTPMLDLDAALGPFKTPPIGAHRQRKELHSNRLAKDFGGPGGHYHRRTESAPALPPFDGARLGMPSHPSMDDVFEEDEEEDITIPAPQAASIAASTTSGAEEEQNVGVEIVDLDSTSHPLPSTRGSDTGLGIQHDAWEPERPTTSHSNATSRLSTFGVEPRGTSIVEETIMEESSPVEDVQIVEAHEEPRASSLTKSSESSETPTVLALPTDLLTLPEGAPSVTTPESSQPSSYSSPDFSQRQTSFDHSRLGTSASSMTDNRTMSSCATGDHSHELRMSVDDVPSLTSSRSTMLSTAYANNSRRDFGGTLRTPSATSGAIDPIAAAERRRKRSSIQSLSQLLGKTKSTDELRPHTAVGAPVPKDGKKKEHRLKRLMFWKSKQTANSPTA